MTPSVIDQAVYYRKVEQAPYGVSVRIFGHSVENRGHFVLIDHKYHMNWDTFKFVFLKRGGF